MEMTQEKAIKRLKTLKARCERLVVSSDRGPEEWRKDAEAVDFALSALRPVSREQVEKVWRGEWIGDNDERVGTIDGSPTKSATCSVCGNWLVGSDEYDCSGHFCPACGRAMTDEAVEMVMERMEALRDET